MEGFIPHIIGNTETTAFYYMPAANAEFKIGEALYLNSSTGYVTLCPATTVPEYICMENTGATVAAGTTVCVTPVRDDIVYETHPKAQLSAIPKVGEKLSIGSDGLTVAANGQGATGVAEVVYASGKETTDIIHVKLK